MFAAYRHPARSYRELAVETALTDSDPHRMIAMLFDGGIEAIGRARRAIAKRDIPGRGQAITHAIRIIDEGLKASLDDRAGQLAQNLRALYEYMTLRLLVANRDVDDTVLAEVSSLLETLRDGWAGITPGR
jgi:flagellar protein FliS